MNGRLTTVSGVGPCAAGWGPAGGRPAAALNLIHTNNCSKSMPMRVPGRLGLTLLSVSQNGRAVYAKSFE